MTLSVGEKSITESEQSTTAYSRLACLEMAHRNTTTFGVQNGGIDTGSREGGGGRSMAMGGDGRDCCSDSLQASGEAAHTKSLVHMGATGMGGWGAREPGSARGMVLYVCIVHGLLYTTVAYGSTRSWRMGGTLGDLEGTTSQFFLFLHSNENEITFFTSSHRDNLSQLFLFPFLFVIIHSCLLS